MKIRKMTRCAMLAALMAVCAWISVPVGDQAVSLQTFGVFLALGLLGGKLGAATVLVYLLLGAAGLPVFSGFRGGFGVLLGPTGGYLWGFLLACLLYWAVENRLPRWAALVFGLLCCYACGTAWYYFAYAHGALWPVILTCVVPYVIPDAIKILLALMMTEKINHLIR
jgi:biotin transport system substrate-specific component